MSWEALPGLAQAGFCTEVVLSASEALFGEPFHGILPSLPPQPSSKARRASFLLLLFKLWQC